MRIDLFELIEGLFRGIVYFIYNLVETTAAVVRHPIKGPIRLYRLHVRTERRQIGGLTYLFLVSVVLQWVLLNWVLFSSVDDYVVQANQPSGLSGWRERLAALSLTAPTFDLDALWPLILGSIVSTVIIDAVLRLVLRGRFPRRVRYRQMLLAGSEYALLWMILAALMAAILFALVVDDGIDDSVEKAIYIWGGLAVFAGSFPGAAILRSTRATRSPADLEWVMTGLRMIGIFLLFAVAWFAGAALSADVHSRRSHQQYRDFPAHVKTMRCTVLPDGQIDVDGMIYVKPGAAQAVGAGHFALDILPGPNDQPVRSGHIGWRTARPDHFVAVGDGSPLVVELRAPKYKRPPGALCRLKVRDAVADGDGIPFTRDCALKYGSPDRAEGLRCWDDPFNREMFERVQW